MAEKRFSYNVNKNTIECDGKFVAYVNCVDGFRIANKLSVLSNENEQLKNRLKQAIHEINDYTCSIKQLQDKIDVKEALLKQYEEENEQLKQRITYLERKIQRERTSAMKQHEKWEKELKATIKEAYQSERTMIGKSVLKQLMETIQ